jgi:type II secretory pathway predicted ATPase ExeA
MEAKESRGALPALAEMQELMREIEAWRIARGFSDVTFCETFPLAGSRKTYGMFARAEPSKWDRKPEDWLSDYRALRQSLRDYDNQAAEPPALVFDYVAAWDAAVDSLRRRSNEKRVLWAEGEHGSGKTVLLRRLVARVGPERAVLVRGKQSWRSLGVMLEDMLRALGEKLPERKRPESAARLQGRLSAVLKARKDVVVCIDEGHMIHGPGMNVLRDLVNDMEEAGTLVHFAGVALPGVWDTMTERFAAESKQLRRRFCDLVPIPSPSLEECRLLLGQRVESGEIGAAELTLITQKAQRCGQRSMVADVGDGLARLRSLTPEKIRAVLASVVRKNGEK